VPHEVFADEIAIDFPSVDPLIERVRDAFLGERRSVDQLTTEVSVSSVNATAGTIVPLEIPLRGTCAFCGGRGETWAEPCLACSGSGESLVYHPVRFSVPAGVADGASFRFRVRSPDARSVRVEVRVAIRNV
jgi:DnaJ-class molecular chaperone